MIRIFLFLLAVALVAGGAAWLADRPGDVVLRWQGWHVETSVTVLLLAIIVLVIALMALWAILRLVFGGPAAVTAFFRARRREKGHDALSRGMIAAAAGDRRGARRYAGKARKMMRGEPLTLLLEAQAAQLSGDRKAARQAFEAMLTDPETELLGLRGLYIEAERAGDEGAARIHAQRAADKAPGLPWAANAVLEFHTKEGDWQGALEAVERNADNRVIEGKAAKRARAVLLTAQAMDYEADDPDKALELALEAHRLAPELVPAAAIAGRLAAANGAPRQATRILEKTWRLSPHPEIAEIYAHARPGDSARDRLKRARTLASRLPNEPEGRVAVAAAAIEARDWPAAREALKPLLATTPRRRVCLLMAEIEQGEHGDSGRVREWLSRALRAPRDPAWVADGYVSDRWMPVSPVSGRLDAFDWATPPEAIAADVDIPEPPAPDPAPTPDVKELVIEAQAREPSDAPTPPAADEAEAARPWAEPPPSHGDGPDTERAATEVPAEPASEEAPADRPETDGAPPARPKPEAKSEAEATVEFPRPPDDPGPDPEDKPSGTSRWAG